MRTASNKNLQKDADYRRLRASLIHRGYTLRSFALRHGYSISTVTMAARGERNGVVASRIRRHLEELAK